MDFGVWVVVELKYSEAAACTYVVEYVNIEYGSCIDTLLSLRISSALSMYTALPKQVVHSRKTLM